MFKAACKMSRAYPQIGFVEPDELVQNAMLKLLQRSGDSLPTTGWLYKVMRSTAKEAARQYLKESSYIYWPRAHGGVFEQSDEYVNARSCQVMETEPEIDLMPRIKNMLDNLSKPARQVLVLYADGLTYEEISRLTRTPIGTVRSRLHYARRRAKKLLTDLA